MEINQGSWNRCRLPTDDDMGNSEVGHYAFGDGRIFAQGVKLVDLALASGKIYEGEGFKYISESFEKGTLHLIGLLSDGDVHSRLDQLQWHGAKRIRVHILTDGRDVADGSRVGFVETLENDLAYLREKGVDARIALVEAACMSQWTATRGWDAQVLGEVPHKFTNAVEAAVGPIVDSDAVVTFNFRADRMYDGELKLPSHYLVSPPFIDRTSCEYLVHNGIRIFACSETVKFGHVTFFWNGNRSGYFNPELEEYVEIPSDIGITFNVQPKMKALEIAEKARDAILSRKFDHVRVNIPNGDMVGHTGDIQATIVGCKSADEAVKLILDAIERVGGIFVVTADHGNAEDMVKRTGVRFQRDVLDGGLANVAATVMNLHGFVAPSDYEPTLIEVVDK
ncbi:2,3-bisphosphoglycerate-independent phosphoglycerate mutase [Hibiscus syriacus]|uniref:phosphoglycerate mutase (2,3-diphosphoglycerate-independent) n=1 Tax=Hibiscus syriacus TaxID=106335 RepID=A0A6A3CK47_HIBSY|nr:2,3-bisphosphoglycerate-independent phosphoglycerate mutase [Hibiscus syriacus]